MRKNFTSKLLLLALTAAMIASAAILSANEAGASRFTDTGSADGGVGAVVATGYPDGSFDADASISRAEAVSSLNRMLGGTAYQPTQPATPTTDNTNNTDNTTDTTKTTSDDVVIEDKGTTLKNQTVDGNVTIAKSVGNGDVTLRNVTIKGDLIVKGGGSNTVTLEDVDVRGTVRLLKEGVHLHLVGDTYIRKLLIDLAARITQSSSYKDEIGEIILAGDGDLNKTTRIDVPAKQLRIENQADLILGGDVEKLIVDEDAKGAEIEIKKGTTVNELNTDAKIKLTGEGRIDLLNVSASGVTYDKNLDVRKKVTSNGATAPKENGSTSAGGNSGSTGGNSGSSGSTGGNSDSTGGNSGSGGNSGNSGGNSSTASKEITGAEKVTRDVPYGTSADDALKALPTTVTLNLKGGSTISAMVTKWEWGENAAYKSKPSTPASTPAVATVTIPSGYTYSGTLTATAKVTVHPLDKTKLEAAKKAADNEFQNMVNDENAAATDKTKILIIDNKAPADITQGVRFTTSGAKDALEAAIHEANNAENTGFASQKACDDAADALQKAMDTFKKTIQIGTNKDTDAYVLQQVKNELLNPDKGDYAYSSHMQPLKPSYAYYLFNSYYSLTNSSVSVSIEWSVSGSDKVTIGDTGDDDKDSKGNHYSYGAKIADGTTTPTKVTFTATVKNSQTNNLIGTLDYTATIGAPIRATLPSGAPQFTTTRDSTYTTGATKFTGVFPITLKGADAIKSVSNDCVTMDDKSSSGQVSFNTISVDKVEQSSDVLDVTVSVTTGAIGGVWNKNSSFPAFGEGTLPNIHIDMSKFELKTKEEGNPGWYLSTGDWNLGSRTVDVLTPAFTGVKRADDPTTGNPTFTIQTQNMPENAKVEVALAKKDVGASNVENATIKATATRGGDGKYSVTFDKSKFESGVEYYLWFRYGSPGSDWAYEEVAPRPTYTFGNTTSGDDSGDPDSSGPDKLNLGNMTVDVLTPAFTGVERADDPTTGNPTFTIQTQNMPENAKVEVALAKKDVGASNVENATIKATATRGGDGKYSVTFDKSKLESGVEYYLWFRYGSDWSYEKVDSRPTYTFGNTTTGDPDSGDPGNSGSSDPDSGDPGNSGSSGPGSSDDPGSSDSDSSGPSDSGSTGDPAAATPATAAAAASDSSGSGSTGGPDSSSDSGSSSSESGSSGSDSGKTTEGSQAGA